MSDNISDRAVKPSHNNLNHRFLLGKSTTNLPKVSVVVCYRFHMLVDLQASRLLFKNILEPIRAEKWAQNVQLSLEVPEVSLFACGRYEWCDLCVTAWLEVKWAPFTHGRPCCPGPRSALGSLPSGALVRPQLTDCICLFPSVGRGGLLIAGRLQFQSDVLLPDFVGAICFLLHIQCLESYLEIGVV